MSFSAEANTEWFEADAEGEKCYECDQLIIGTKYQLVLFIFGEQIYSKYIYCKYCVNEVKKRD